MSTVPINLNRVLASIMLREARTHLWDGIDSGQLTAISTSDVSFFNEPDSKQRYLCHAISWAKHALKARALANMPAPTPNTDADYLVELDNTRTALTYWISRLLGGSMTLEGWLMTTKGIVYNENDPAHVKMLQRTRHEWLTWLVNQVEGEEEK